MGLPPISSTSSCFTPVFIFSRLFFLFSYLFLECFIFFVVSFFVCWFVSSLPLFSRDCIGFQSYYVVRPVQLCLFIFSVVDFCFVILLILSPVSSFFLLFLIMFHFVFSVILLRFVIRVFILVSPIFRGVQFSDL